MAILGVRYSVSGHTCNNTTRAVSNQLVVAKEPLQDCQYLQVRDVWSGSVSYCVSAATYRCCILSTNSSSGLTPSTSFPALVSIITYHTHTV